MSQTNHRKPSGGGYRLTTEQRRQILERRKRLKRQKQKKLLMLIVPFAVVIVLSTVLALTLPAGNRKNQTAPDAPSAAEPAMSDAVIDAESGADVESEIGGEIPVNSEEGGEPDAYADGDVPDDPVAELAGSVESAAEPAAQATEPPIDYNPPGGVFVFDDAYAAAALGKNTGPLITPDYSNVDPAKLDRWPKAVEGYMPLIYRAKTEEKIIAITVDDCFQGENLRKIVQCALDNNGQLTIFPIGDNLAKSNVAQVVKWAWESGMEIENHTYNHVGLYHFDDERMAKEIWLQNQRLNLVLGVNYKEHFFRPKGGDEYKDQRTHAYVYQMGFSGIALWAQSGSGDSIQKLVDNLAPGKVYLFHTTDKDLEKLLTFIPYATSQGYRLITMNEMFGLPDNETSPLVEQLDPPALEPFRIIPLSLSKTTYARASAVVQKRLAQLGWLKGDADGVYGQSSYVAVGYFQQETKLKADGIAGAATQAALFSDDAPKNR